MYLAITAFSFCKQNPLEGEKPCWPLSIGSSSCRRRWLEDSVSRIVEIKYFNIKLLNNVDFNKRLIVLCCFYFIVFLEHAMVFFCFSFRKVSPMPVTLKAGVNFFNVCGYCDPAALAGDQTVIFSGNPTPNIFLD